MKHEQKIKPNDLLLVAIGGALGTALRIIFAEVFYDGIFAANIVGSFALGLMAPLLERRLALLFSTGLLGGFTTYSAFAATIAVQLGGPGAFAAVTYGVITTMVGLAFAFTGLMLGRWIKK